MLTKLFRRTEKHQPFDIEKAVGHYLLTLPRCASRVLVVSRQFLDKRYHYELTVDTASLATWAEGYAQGAWPSNDPAQAARQALPLWLRLADLSDDQVTLAPKEFFSIWRGYHSAFYEMPNSQVYCHDCCKVIGEVAQSVTQLPRQGLFDFWKNEWHCPDGHLLYQEEVGRHGQKINKYENADPSVQYFLSKYPD